MKTPSHTVIIGAGHSGGTVAHQLRQLGYEGQITLIGDEGRSPYQRPPLSKAWLKGTVDAEDLALRPDTYYTENLISCLLDDSARQIDRARRVVILESGRALEYDHLVIATGAKARKLETEFANGIVYLRNMSDALSLKTLLAREKPRVAILGGGFIGLEVAATASHLGAEVTVIERESRILNRVASQAISDAITHAHQAAGVRILVEQRVERLEYRGQHIASVVLEDGTRVDCDLLLIGIGATPNDDIARESGLECDQGIIVDLNAQTSDPAIFAIGDVTRTRLPDGQLLPRLESVGNALEQARKVAATLTEKPLPKDEAPWFWSDQYELKLQMVGLRPADSEVIVRKALDGIGMSVFHVKDGKLKAAETINSAKDFLISKRAISTGQFVDKDALRNEQRPTAEAFNS